MSTYLRKKISTERIFSFLLLVHFDKYTMSSKYDAVEAQSKAMRDDRRREDDEARGTRFGQEILDTEVYGEDTESGSTYLNYIPGDNDDAV